MDDKNEFIPSIIVLNSPSNFIESALYLNLPFLILLFMPNISDINSFKLTNTTLTL